MPGSGAPPPVPPLFGRTPCGESQSVTKVLTNVGTNGNQSTISNQLIPPQP